MLKGYRTYLSALLLMGFNILQAAQPNVTGKTAMIVNFFVTMLTLYFRSKATAA